MQIRPQPLQNRQHPLPHREPGGWTRSVRCAATSAIRRLLQEEQTPRPSESVSQDPAPQVRPEVPLDPGRNAPASGIFVLGRGEERLEVVLHHRVERGRGRTSRSVDESRCTRWGSVRWTTARRGCLAPWPVRVPPRRRSFGHAPSLPARLGRAMGSRDAGRRMAERRAADRGALGRAPNSRLLLTGTGSPARAVRSQGAS